MGLFKKPVAPIDNDEEIRREIRARVAKQAGIYDEEYINTGKIGGKKTVEEAADSIPASHVSAAAIPIISENAKGETELSFEPNRSEPLPGKADPQVQQAVLTKPVSDAKPQKEKKPPKEKKQKPTKRDSAVGSSQRPKKKKKNIALILFIVVLLLAFIPLYYFLTSSSNQVPEMTATTSDNVLLLTEPLLVQGMVSDADNADGVKVYYSLDSGSASLLYTFDAGPGPFEYQIDLPDTADFVGEHAVTLYAKDPSGELSESIVLNFTVIKPALAKLEITSPPSDVKYKVGDKLSLKGLVVEATYENGDSAEVATFTSDIPDGTKLTKSGNIDITISYIEDNITKTATFSVAVEKATVVTPVTPTRQVNTSYPIPSLEVYRAGPGAADLQWNGLSGVNGYQIQRKTGSGGSWSTVNTLSSAYTSWTDNGPVSGKTYYYRICSYKVVNGVKVFSSFSSARSIAL
jgi:Bacterial Ig-like domain (group 3)